MRILLDTNAWTYLHESGGIQAVRQTSKRHGAAILISPAVVYEQLRDQDEARRRSLVELTTRQTWIRMRPEAWQMSDEFLNAVRVRRPGWIVDPPDPVALTWRRRNEIDWSSKRDGFWSRARADPARQAGANSDMQSFNADDYLADVHRIRGELDRGSNTPDTLDLNSKHVKFVELTFADRPPITMERWAHFTMLLLESRIKSRDPSFGGWLNPHFRAARVVDSVDWMSFWQEVRPSELPTFWLTWAGHVAAAVAKVNSGSPCDVQLFSYLNQADAFVSADKRLLKAIGTVRSLAVISVAVPVRVTPGSIVDEMLSLISPIGP